MAKKIDTEKYVYNVRDVATTRELVETSCELYGNQVAFLYKNGTDITEITYEQAGNDIRAFSTYLNSMGLKTKKLR